MLFDPPGAIQDLLPLTYTRPVSLIRVGILTISEKWERRLNLEPGFITQDYLSHKYPGHISADNLVINGSLCPNDKLVEEVEVLKSGQALVQDQNLLAFRGTKAQLQEWIDSPKVELFDTRSYNETATVISKPWEIFIENHHQIELDYQLITRNRQSAPINDSFTRVYNIGNVFLEKGVQIRAAIINAEEGPVYIGKEVIIQEGAVIKGPFGIGEGSNVSMGSRIRGNVSVGPYCKVGGEIINSVVLGYSNKGHDGFLGCSVVGKWCNIGADTNTSNLKNNYEDIKLWNYSAGARQDSGHQFLGLIMGDHSKCGINTMFNTGTVVGVSANIFGTGFPSTFVPSYSWGGIQGFDTFRLEKSFEVAQKVMYRRHMDLNQLEKEILTEVFERSKKWRHWETV